MCVCVCMFDPEKKQFADGETNKTTFQKVAGDYLYVLPSLSLSTR